MLPLTRQKRLQRKRKALHRKAARQAQAHFKNELSWLLAEAKERGGMDRDTAERVAVLRRAIARRARPGPPA